MTTTLVVTETPTQVQVTEAVTTIAVSDTPTQIQVSDTLGAHDLAGALHNAATLAAINAKISDDDLVGLAATQTLSNKTLASPIITGTMFIGDTANANMTSGLTINQGANDNEAFALKSSDVAHGRVSLTETDTYFSIRKYAGDNGGVLLQGVQEDTAQSRVMQIALSGGTADTTKTTAGVGLLDIVLSEHDGADGSANITTDGNVMSVRAVVGGSTVARMLVDEDGDIFAVNATVTALDNESDIDLIRTFEMNRAEDGIVRSKWDSFVRYNEDDLVRVGVLGAPVEDGGMWNITQHIRLINGALWQEHVDALELKQQVNELTQQVKALQEAS